MSAGKPVNTVPQIFLDEQHIGGCTGISEAYAVVYNLGSVRQFLMQARLRRLFMAVTSQAHATGEAAHHLPLMLGSTP